MKRWERVVEDTKSREKIRDIISRLSGMPTRQRILFSAASLFALKGFSETTIEEIMENIGMSNSSLYTYFANKNSILDCLLTEYSNNFIEPGFLERQLNALIENPTTDGVMSCLKLSFPTGQEEYYLNILYVILHEQHRNPAVRKFVADKMILQHENTVKAIIEKLIEINILRPDTDVDFFSRMQSSLIYAFSNRRLLGISDAPRDFISKSMFDWLRSLYDMMFKIYGFENEKDTGLEKDIADLMRSLNDLINKGDKSG